MARWTPAALVLVPGVLAAGFVVAEVARVDVPARCAPAARCTKVLGQVADDRDSALLRGALGALVVLLAGTAVALLLAWARGRRARRSGDVERQRAALVRVCVEVSDVVDSDALREQLVDALADAGVTPVDVPAGEPFDSSRHHAIGQLDTTDAARHNLVARTERSGFVDRGKRLRYPDVVVFSANARARR